MAAKYTITVHTPDGTCVSGKLDNLPTYPTAEAAIAAHKAIPGYPAAAKCGWTYKVWKHTSRTRHDGSRFYTAHGWDLAA